MEVWIAPLISTIVDFSRSTKDNKVWIAPLISTIVDVANGSGNPFMSE